MKLFIMRWAALLISAAVSVWLTNNVSISGFIGTLGVIGIVWLLYTLYTKRSLKWSLLSYILTPLFIWASALSLMIFMREGFQHWLMIGFAFVLSWAWSSTLTQYDIQRGEDIFRGNLISYINSFVLFFSASALFAADVFISFSPWHSLLIILPLSFMLHFQAMRASHIALQKAALYSLIACLFITELFASLLFWPSAFLVNGIIITVAFYMLAGVSRCMLTSVLSRKLISKYLAWGSFIIFVILITADWQ